MIVMKFGGTSVGNAERIKAVANIIKSYLEKKPVVVVSAVAGATNALIDIAKESNKDTRLEMIAALTEVHKKILADLALDMTLLEPELQELTKLAKISKKIAKKQMDTYVSFGERMSAKIVAGTLIKMDINAKALLAWDIGMITDEHFGSAEPLPEATEMIRQKIAAMKAIPIVTGFIGKTRRGSITTLGRGGSDYTAAIIGAAIKAEAIQIWKEVDGIMTTDPRLVPEAQVIPELAFEEAGELAYFGAKVLHPKTILPAMQAGVPVQVLNTFNPAGKAPL
jgi:aspartate kinase